MNSKSRPVTVGRTKTFPCSYLEEQQEQLMVLQEDVIDIGLFEQLLALGFRRSGSMIYKPQCPQCSACLPIRLDMDEFKLSKRQKRTLKKNQDLSWKIVDHKTPQQYELYERYVNTRHADGPMYPATPEQYDSFATASWLQPLFIELRQGEELVGVAVTDVLPHSLSAIYSYFAPELEKRSLGSLLILLQTQITKMMQKRFLYLGYQIDESRKMNYKRDYRPHQILTQSGWVSQIAIKNIAD
ncbi:MULTISPECIES: arginyltransferase [unclassified Shewanella]|uniref:arginyltransferase n=1 Tax=unclassified Shewanella TaxID=196818 RepID=UPI001BB97335|nr:MULTISPECIES: arginyltransferase [unclassified Shewanella]GIU12788.1 putative arginyl-tRNA--protein transferase [Shewanella sp. MBTL60-112-B1]GIU38167.1 putative arginyl-tRNA--protein transferase [Shewanella sp. MBTL60-112-B2]